MFNDLSLGVEVIRAVAGVREGVEVKGKDRWSYSHILHFSITTLGAYDADLFGE